MRTFLILNPKAGSAKSGAFLREAATDKGVVVEQTTQKGEGTQLARQAVADGYHLVIAAGGDGTVNEVVNGRRPPIESMPRYCAAGDRQ
jgi:diacylglycerol kinase family enzyme